jgi:tripartite-type tricarboxylate transporter receptor subunit TctC
MKCLAQIALALLAATAGLVHAEWPERPIKIIVPFTAGSGTDIVGRTVAEAMQKSLGQPIIIENRPGAGGTLGAGQVAKSAPDGYTLLVNSASHTSNPSIYANLPYDTLKDFAGITPLASLPNVLVVSPARGWKTVKDMVDAGHAKPGSLNYGSAGIGSATHMNAEIFKKAANLDMTHIPFKGTPEAMTETATGRIDFYFAPISSALPLIHDNRLVPLAVGTATRSPQLPNVPTTIEAGYPHSEFVFWVGFFAPAGTPRAIVDRLNAEALKALASPETKGKLEVLGAEPMPMSPAAFDAFVRQDVARMAEVVKSAGIKAQ